LLLAGLVAGLLCGVGVLADFLVFESAVLGLAISARRRGRTGADDRVPVDWVETWREAVDMAVAGLAGAISLAGDAKDSADPGRSGRFLPAALALF